MNITRKRRFSESDVDIANKIPRTCSCVLDEATLRQYQKLISSGAIAAPPQLIADARREASIYCYYIDDC